MTAREINRMLDATGAQEIEAFSDSDALEERIRDWLETPQGSVADQPEWGNTLSLYRHAPINNDLLISMEMDILTRLPADVDGVNIQGIRIQEEEIDTVRISILFNEDVQDFEYDMEVVS